MSNGADTVADNVSFSATQGSVRWLHQLDLHDRQTAMAIVRHPHHVLNPDRVIETWTRLAHLTPSALYERAHPDWRVLA